MKTTPIWIAMALVAATALGVSGQGTKANVKPPAAAAKPSAVSFIRTPIGSSEMTVEMPGKASKITVPLEERIRTSYDILETVGLSGEDLACFASYAVSRGNKPISLDGAARGALDRVKGQAQADDYKESVVNAAIVGLPGRRIGCSFTAGERKMFLAGIIFTDRTRMWQVICTGVLNTSNTNTANRVLASVKRNSGGESALNR